MYTDRTEETITKTEKCIDRTEENIDGAQENKAKRKAPRPQKQLGKHARRACLFFWEILYFPIVLLYLEIVFHLYMGMDMAYLPAFGTFAVAMGMIFSAVLVIFPKGVNRVLKFAATAFVGFLFGVEMVCRDILQQYYQLFSAMETAAGNHLGDYSDAVIDCLIDNWMGVLVFLIVPVLFATMSVLVRTYFKKKRLGGLKRFLKVLPFCVILHLAGLAAVNYYPWEGDFTPKKLYYTDTNTEDQVEQLGVITMIRLDGKHAIFGAPEGTDIDLDALTAGEEADAADTRAEELIPEEIVYEPNVMEVDLQSIIDGDYNSDVKWLSEFIQASEPTMQNEYTGLFEGYNVIFITAEGFSGYVIDEALTPTLYKLSHEGFVFNNFYSALHFTSTSGGEFQNLTGLYPKNGFPVSMTETGKQSTYLPFTLANTLNQEGYTSIGYHFNSNMYGRTLSHPNLGYEWRQTTECDNPLTVEKDESGSKYWPQSDDYMVEATFDEYIGQEPFNIYYLTISGHLPYSNGGNNMSARNSAAVADLPYSSTTKAYIGATLELEKGLTRLVENLEAAGVADHTLIVLAPDHVPYADLDVLEELAGQSFGSTLETLDESAIDFDVYKNTLIMWSASMEEPVEVDKICCQVDILPTILNLLGEEYDSRMLSGTDILSDSEGLVAFVSNSWMTDKGFYNRFTGKFTPAEGVTMTEEEQEAYVNRIKTLVSCRLEMSSIIIENDYYDIVFDGE